VHVQQNALIVAGTMAIDQKTVDIRIRDPSSLTIGPSCEGGRYGFSFSFIAIGIQ
jgi:hypothetical protein